MTKEVSRWSLPLQTWVKSLPLTLPPRPGVLVGGISAGKGALLPGAEPGFGNAKPPNKARVLLVPQLLNILVWENKIVTFFMKVFYVCWCIMYLLLIEVNSTFCNLLF